ncbi:HAD-IIA family hydrolase [Thiorhodococcus mannitoliphagus]|uniref:HAD-IIA family hydrolase n=1 Tax=Thiorhodococcus mannitoliphagus TaxID=329406 RepID=A0A6P1DTY6_9GAMM|nr:HAD-IIA family hydrolase [Thiorhodococcus mannitoliphagus]NEX20156.1 HAD-IIA family hydrolase [Thiorhodococcus mannitoliphagus]
MRRPDPSAVLLDMDGVLFHGAQALPGAERLLASLARTPHAYVTNNPIRTPDEVANAFVAMGLPRPDRRLILTSALATARWLSRVHPGFRYFSVGAGGLDAALRAVGQPDAEDADFVIVGEGPGLDFDQLTTGINLILQQGARLIGTNPDHSVDAVRDGKRIVLPGGGALIAPFATATGVTPTIIGKPEPLLYEMALEVLGCSPGECLMIGDRPDTDIAGAERLGMWTALVRTGRFAPRRPWPKEIPAPDFDAVDLDALMSALRDSYPRLIA